MTDLDNTVIFGDNLAALMATDDEDVDLIYVDPPFNTGKHQVMTRTQNYGDVVSQMSYADMHDDYLAFLMPRMVEARRVLSPFGTLYCHLDHREVHYVKVMLDHVFGRDCFLNEVIWAYDYGGRSKTRWPAKHDTILVYVKDPKQYIFNYDDIDRIPYMAPSRQTQDRIDEGKTPTDTWWHTIVHTQGAERTGYPNQKPLGILRRIVLASSDPGSLVMDFFAGSGSFGVAAKELGRRFTLIDNNQDAWDTMRRQFANDNTIDWIA